MGSKRIRKKKDDQSKQLQQKHVALTTSEYEVTYEPLEDKNVKKLPPKVQDQLDELFYMVHHKPKIAIPELENLIEKYPHIPQFYNFLQAAYANIGNMRKSREIILKTYERHPNYLFAKLNYAELCINDGDLEKFPIIFDNKLDLKMLYPERNRFHISEAVSFMGVIGSYFYKLGRPEIAENYYDFLKQVAPKHPMTKRLKRVLYPSRLLRALKKFIHKGVK